MEQVGTNGPEHADLVGFITAHTGRAPKVWEAADLLAAYDLDGAQAEAFMAAYARTFGVDLAGYEPAFHHRDASTAARFGWPVPVPHRFGTRLPLALSTLVQAAQTGRWPVRYPQLQPVTGRDWLNWPLVLVALPLAVAVALWLFRALV